VNSDKNIKRKEMKNNDSPLDNKYTLHSPLHALHIVSQVSNAFVTHNPNTSKLNTLCRCQI